MNRDELHNEIIEDLGGHVSDGQLPQFLNVLTILTFIGSGLALIMGLYNLTTVDEQQANIDLLNSMPSANFLGPEFTQAAQAALDNIYLLQGTGIIAAILCLIGAYLMRKLSKTGFFLYIVASVASVAVPISVVGFGLMGMMILIGAVFTIAFVIMYSVNFKYLK
ncbi:MAG: hypothetical protein GQ574_23410 [Crocinitomix sp.]|nr:hypothetical protein [Crocinitomix sp.]